MPRFSSALPLTLGAVAAIAVAGCTTVPEDSAGWDRVATTTLRDANGRSVGTAEVHELAGRMRLSVAAAGLSPGPHGLHLHTRGECTAPGFESAGGHWNPSSAQHGVQNPAGPHAGDLPNLVANSAGAATGSFDLPASATRAGLFDADGTALVIHAGPDDLRTDPTGNSGGRVACGVLSAR